MNRQASTGRPTAAFSIETTDLVMPGMGRRVLVVDDDPIQRKLVRTQLEAAGFSVETAVSAEDALDTIRRNRPDAILSDVLMDHTDGFAFCRAIRSDPGFAAIPIILMSAYFNEIDDRALAREVGATDLVERCPTLQGAIASLLRGLARDSQESAEDCASDLHLRRMTHQLVRLRDDSARSEARYLALFENANDAVSITTSTGVVVDMNRRWEAIMQRPRTELIGLPMRELLQPGAAVPSADGHHRGPIPVAGGCGVVHLEFTTTEIEVDGARHLLMIGRDVTELVASHRALAESEQRYRSLLESIPEVVWSATKDLQLQFVSPNALEMMGYSAPDLMQGGVAAILARVHADDLARLQAALDALPRDRKPLDLEYRWQRRDGRWIWIHARAVLARHLDGVEYVDGILSDVTQRRLVEEQLVRSQKIEAIGQLTAGIAHDFNNILAVTLANAQYLEETLPEGEPREVAHELLLTSQRGTELTSRLLAFARRESAEPRAVDLGEVVRGVAPLIARTIGRSIRLTITNDPTAESVRAIPSEVEQVLMNLAVNARDAMPNGGELAITTTAMTIDSDTADGAVSPGRYVALSVKDSGVGMEAATLERIFEPFFTTKAAGKGTGLGLSTSYGIVRRLGGHVVVDSTPGAGATFTIYFPAAPPGAPESTSATIRGSRSVSMGLAM